MSSSPPARAFSGITHMRIAGITLYAGLTSGYKWWEDAWNWVCGAAQDVGEFISDNIGLETHVEVTHREIELKTLLGGYEYGKSGSWSCGANSDKPIVLYAKKASQ